MRFDKAGFTTASGLKLSAIMEMVHFIPPGQRRLAVEAAQSDTSPILICGASGTGKGAIARWIHNNGPRAGKPLVLAIQKLTFSEQVVHAQGGTVVVHEIGEWPMAEQASILGFLKSKTVLHPDQGYPDQGLLPMLLNVRIVATSSHGLEARAQGGLFNPELLEKIGEFRIEMPPLSKRTDEFRDIVLGILGESTKELGKTHLRDFPVEAWRYLADYHWPGNLRELRNVLRLAVVSAQGDQIEFHNIPKLGQETIDFRATREQFEKIYLLEILKNSDWRLDLACESTRMDKKFLLSKLARYGIEIPGPKGLTEKFAESEKGESGEGSPESPLPSP